MSLSFSASARAVSAPDVLFQTIEDESILLKLKTKLYVGQDAVGTRVWTTLAGAESFQQPLDSLLAVYDVEAEQLRRDLEEYLGDLQQNGLTEVCPGGDTVP